MKNPNCDNDKCISPHGEVRVLPIGGDSNAILCWACYKHEMRYRKMMNRGLYGSTPPPATPFKIPAWEDLKIYNPEE